MLTLKWFVNYWPYHIFQVLRNLNRVNTIASGGKFSVFLVLTLGCLMLCCCAQYNISVPNRYGLHHICSKRGVVKFFIDWVLAWEFPLLCSLFNQSFCLSIFYVFHGTKFPLLHTVHILETGFMIRETYTAFFVIISINKELGKKNDKIIQRKINV